MSWRTNRRVQLHKRHQVFIGVRNETPSIVAVRVSNEDYRISVAAGADRGHVNEQRETRAPFDYAASGSSRIRFRADLASHSRAFCRNSEALRSASFSLMRIWCVSMVLTLTFNSLANSETLMPLPINEKISSSRSLRLLTSEPSEPFLPAAKLLTINGKTLALTYSRPAEISSKALTISAAPSRVKYPRAPTRNARRSDSASVRSDSTTVAAAGSSLTKSLIS